MSRRKDDLADSRWGRFKRWLDGEVDPLMAPDMETVAPRSAEAAGQAGSAVREEAAGQAGSAVRTEAAGQTGSAARTEAAGQAGSTVREEAAGQAGSAVRAEAAGQAGSASRAETAVQTGTAAAVQAGAGSAERRAADRTALAGTDGSVRPAAQAVLPAKRRKGRLYGRVYQVMSVILCLGIIAVLLWTIAYLPVFGNAGNPDNNEVSARYIERGLQETGAVNIVTGMILDYRAFDTFGESCVLFIASCCVLVLLRIDKESGAEGVKERLKAADDRRFEPKEDIILQKCAMVLSPVIFVFGIYIILNGHLSPGGGFSGGAVLGSGLILYLNAFGFEKTERFFNTKTYRRITVSALSFYCLAKSYSFFTGANHLESGIPLGTPGAIISSGLILPLNICVGMVVACTMYAFYTLFRKGDM